MALRTRGPRPVTIALALALAVAACTSVETTTTTTTTTTEPALATEEPASWSAEPITPEVDGFQAEGEWAGATSYAFPDGTPRRLLAGLDGDNLYLLLDGFAEPMWIEVQVPSAQPARGTTSDGREVGFGITHELQLAFDQACLAAATEEGTTDLTCYLAASADGLWEAAIPLGDLGTLESGDRILFRVLGPDGDLLPRPAPGFVRVP